MPELDPSFHDGTLTGIHVGDGFALLSLKQANGEAWQVRLAGLEVLQMDDFRQGNIILSVETIVAASPEREPFDRLFGAPHPSAAAEYHEAYAQLISRKMATVEEGGATLVVLTPAYGADLVALCEAVSCKAISMNGS